MAGSTIGFGGAVLGLRVASTVRKGRPKALAQLSGLERSWSIVLETRAYLCGGHTAVLFCTACVRLAYTG